MRNGREETVQLLLDRKVSAFYPEVFPLASAAACVNLSIAKLLIAYGAHPNDGCDQVAFTSANRKGHTHIFDYFSTYDEYDSCEE